MKNKAIFYVDQKSNRYYIYYCYLSLNGEITVQQMN